MWLTTPETIEQVLVEGQLAPVSDAALDQSAREWRNRGEQLTPQEALREMPVVKIGQPEPWRLQDLYGPGELPRAMQVKLDEADFYLVRFSCSFQASRDGKGYVEWARFGVNLLAHPVTGAQPVAFDFFPQQVMQEAKHPIKVTLNPLLKFQEVEASLGSAEFGLEYAKQVPIISAAIRSSFDPSWDYRSRSKPGVLGTKWMYLLIKAPKGLTGAQAHLELEADVVIGGSLLAVRLRRHPDQVDAQLTVSLWG